VTKPGRRTGHIGYLNTHKAFGKIYAPTREGGGYEEYFFHLSMCNPQGLFFMLEVGDPVSFFWQQSPKGLRAFGVERDAAGGRLDPTGLVDRTVNGNR
jgi:cold shock CspA family protein